MAVGCMCGAAGYWVKTIIYAEHNFYFIDLFIFPYANPIKANIPVIIVLVALASMQ